jgi:hypothetical protein
LAPAVHDVVSAVIGVGEAADETVLSFAQASGEKKPALPRDREHGEALVWFRNQRKAIVVRPEAPKGEQDRHRRKYAQGELGEDKSFYFRGPEGRLNLRAQNLVMFVQMAEGVDDETWLHHLRRGDYSTWLRDSIKDDELADGVAAIEQGDDGAAETLARVKRLIEDKYTQAA